MSDWRADLVSSLEGRAGARFDEPLARLTTFRIGGPARMLVEVPDRVILARLLVHCANQRIRWMVLGRGSNLLVSSQEFRGVVVRLVGNLAAVRVDGARLSAGAGASFDSVVDAAAEAGLCGVEFLAGIPGTVGGGLLTNAGACGRSIGDAIENLTVIDTAGRIHQLRRTELPSGYRRRLLPDGVVAVEVAFELKAGRPEDAAAVRERRWAKQPGEPSAGSFFRNPASEPAGRIIDGCGLKGRRIGGAMVSDVHANFIVNSAGASFADVYELSQAVKAVVEETTGIVLEEEVQVVPSFPAGTTYGRPHEAAADRR